MKQRDRSLAVAGGLRGVGAVAAGLVGGRWSPGGHTASALCQGGGAAFRFPPFLQLRALAGLILWWCYREGGPEQIAHHGTWLSGPPDSQGSRSSASSAPVWFHVFLPLSLCFSLS